MSQIPFIDIAVQDAVRETMLNGKAAIIFDQSVDQIIWANGTAAKMFGYEAIGEFLVAGIASFNTTLRQLKSAAARKPRTPQPVLLRITVGMRSDAHHAQLHFISIDGADEDVALLTFDRQNSADQNTLLYDAIAGLEEDGAGAAMLGEDGDILVSGSFFNSLDIPQPELHALTDEVHTEEDRLVKRLVLRGEGKTKIAVGIGRLSEEPVRNLLVAMETEIEQTAPLQTKEAKNTSSDTVTPKMQVIDSAPPLVDHDDDDEFAFEEAPTSDDNDDGKNITSFEPVIAAAEAKPEEFKADFNRRPVRFVWKTDIDGCFTEVSEEFSGAVGNNAADIVGRTMKDVAKVFELDNAGEIEASMARRDTWSGKTVLWPVQSTTVRVPVDLAALPYYNRNREFEGYRGFGIVRLSDYVDDPEQLGLSLHQMTAPEPVAEAEVEDTPAPADDHTAELNDSDLSDQGEEDLFGGEPPVFQSASITPMRRESDKIVPLDEHRKERRKIESLDAGEAAAFKKIGEALGKKADEPKEEIEDHLVGEDDSSVAPEREEDLPLQQLQPFVVGSTDSVEQQVEFIEFNDDSDDSDDSDDEAAPISADIEDDVELSHEHTGYQDDETARPLAGIGPDELNALPLPLLIVRGETALYGNEAFSNITGFKSVEKLNDLGLTALFADGYESSGDESAVAKSTIKLIAEDGREITTRAHLQIVPWLGHNALMFAFEPIHSEDEETSRDDSSVESVSDTLRSTAFDEVAEMRAILDTATDGVVVIAQDGTIRSINSAASALFGYANDDVAGKSFSILFATESQRAAMDYLNGFSDYSVASLLNEGREVLARERNGGFLPVFMTIGKLPTSNGFCAVMRDITSWKQTEQALETARQEAENASNIKSEFLAKVSHEIRTPLNAIIGFSELMSEERFGPIGNERYREYLIDINKSGRHVLDMVNDLLDISKIEAGEQELEFESVILNETVADAISMIQPQANRNRIIVRSSLESRLPSVVADTRSVKQIVLNLLSNAIRFTQSGGQVVVSTNYTAAGSVILRIRDTGIGMSSREIETALKPFQQISTRDREHSDGTGLGLPLTRALVHANRAEFEIASEPGRGTSIEITFPPARVLAD
ncbi:PAS domain S-box protein [Ahrensia marina]|uniref:histidine kinase n=1 Tax=Ahrensia marina TaxID=1514904 RepID=A0A0N1J6K1_9HYPH|nr:PAS domain S-box protein [Ahrensia marina]KPB02524.1 hypothetical protein SU32_01865 [Ahrensia marina]